MAAAASVLASSLGLEPSGLGPPGGATAAGDGGTPHGPTGAGAGGRVLRTAAVKRGARETAARGLSGQLAAAAAAGKSAGGAKAGAPKAEPGGAPPRGAAKAGPAGAGPRQLSHADSDAVSGLLALMGASRGAAAGRRAARGSASGGSAASGGAAAGRGSQATSRKRKAAAPAVGTKAKKAPKKAPAEPKKVLSEQERKEIKAAKKRAQKQAARAAKRAALEKAKAEGLVPPPAAKKAKAKAKPAGRGVRGPGGHAERRAPLTVRGAKRRKCRPSLDALRVIEHNLLVRLQGKRAKGEAARKGPASAWEALEMGEEGLVAGLGDLPGAPGAPPGSGGGGGGPHGGLGPMMLQLYGHDPSAPVGGGDAGHGLSRCLFNLPARQWCANEWFYAAIDRPWFSNREYSGFLQHVGLGPEVRLTRAEWGLVRSALGRPRRLSLRFLREGRQQLDDFRLAVRRKWQSLRTTASATLPMGMPKPLFVSQRVTARHPKTRQLHDGQILSIAPDKRAHVHVQFDRPELRVELLRDAHVMPQTAPDPTQAQGAAGQFGTLFDAAALAQQTQGFTEATVPPDARKRYQTQLQALAREQDALALAQVDRILDWKAHLLADLCKMNDEAQEGIHLDAAGQVAGQFQQRYAVLVRNLKLCNGQLMAAFGHLHRRGGASENPGGTPAPAGGIAAGGAATPLAHVLPTPAPPQLAARSAAAAESMERLQRKVLEQVAAGSCHIVDNSLNLANRALAEAEKRRGGGDGEHEEAVEAPPAKKQKRGEGGAGGGEETFSGGGGGEGSSALDEAEAQQLATLTKILGAVAYAIQQCAEQSTPPLITAAALDMISNSLQARASCNGRFVAQIRNTLNALKGQLLVT